MKPVAPEVPLAVWKNLYLSAREVHSLRPWEHFDDTALIGVRDPVTGEAGYGCFMGCGGTLFGFCLYRGAEGFDFYRRLMEGHFAPESIDFIFKQRCLKLEFGARGDLEPEDLSVIKALGLTFRGKTGWPEFRTSTIFLSDAATLASLSPLSKALEIPFDLSPKLPAATMAMDEMRRAMDSGRFRT